MSRLISLLLIAVLALGLVIALDPQAHTNAETVIHDLESTLKRWSDTVIIHAPIIGRSVDKAPVPTPTPVATPSPNDDNTQDSSHEPFIIINWDALGDSLRKLWESLNARINTDIK